jgi:hypothetical protein
MFVGWDWASATHDVTVLDDAGAVVDRWAFGHTEQGLAGRWSAWPATGTPPRCRSSSSAAAAWSSSGCWPPGTRSCPCTPPRSGLPARAGVCPGPSPTPATATSSPTTCAPTATGCAGWTRPIQACSSSRPWSGFARTTCVPAPRPATSSAPCWTPTGPDPRRCSSGWRRDRAGLPGRPPDPAGRQPPRRGPHGQLLPPPQLPRRQATSGPAGQAALGADRAGRHPGGHAGVTARRPGPTACTLLATIAELESRIATRLASHPRAAQFASLPGVGTINLAQLLAEVGPILDRVGSAEQAAAECGAAPVTKASGKTSGVYFRWAANRRARKALTAFAHNSRLASPWAGRLYADARARGKRNPTPPAELAPVSRTLPICLGR